MKSNLTGILKSQNSTKFFSKIKVAAKKKFFLNSFKYQSKSNQNNCPGKVTNHRGKGNLKQMTVIQWVLIHP